MSELNQKKSRRGGARPGAGRPRGARNRITVQDLLEAIDHTAGQSYESLLIQDFLSARAGNDNHLTHKYHTLISNKILSTLATVEVQDTTAAVAQKQAAFQEAMAQIAGIAQKQ